MLVMDRQGVSRCASVRRRRDLPLGAVLLCLLGITACAVDPYVLSERAAPETTEVFSPVTGMPVGSFTPEGLAAWRQDWLAHSGYREAALGEPGAEWAAMREGMAAQAEALDLGLEFSERGVHLWETGPLGAGEIGHLEGRLDGVVARLVEHQDLLVEIWLVAGEETSGIPWEGIELAARLAEAGVPQERMLVKRVPRDAFPPDLHRPVVHFVPLEPKS